MYEYSIAQISRPTPQTDWSRGCSMQNQLSSRLVALQQAHTYLIMYSTGIDAPP